MTGPENATSNWSVTTASEVRKDLTVPIEIDPDGEGPLPAIKARIPLPQSKLFWVALGYCIGILSYAGYMEWA